MIARTLYGMPRTKFKNSQFPKKARDAPTLLRDIITAVQEPLASVMFNNQLSRETKRFNFTKKLHRNRHTSYAK